MLNILSVEKYLNLPKNYPPTEFELIHVAKTQKNGVKLSSVLFI